MIRNPNLIVSRRRGSEIHLKYSLRYLVMQLKLIIANCSHLYGNFLLFIIIIIINNHSYRVLVLIVAQNKKR